MFITNLTCVIIVDGFQGVKMGNPFWWELDSERGMIYTSGKRQGSSPPYILHQNNECIRTSRISHSTTQQVDTIHKLTYNKPESFTVNAKQELHALASKYIQKQETWLLDWHDAIVEGRITRMNTGSRNWQYRTANWYFGLYMVACRVNDMEMTLRYFKKAINW